MMRRFRNSLGKCLADNRAGLMLGLQILLAAASFSLAFLLRFDFGPIPPSYLAKWAVTLPIAVVLKVVALRCLGATRGLWRYVGMSDLVGIIKACTASTLALVVAIVFFYGHGFPRSVYLIDYVLSVVLFGGARFAVRFLREAFRPALRRASGKRTLIIGAGDAGEIALRSLMKDYMGVYSVVGFLDDDPGKQKMSIHGYPILGTVADAARLVKELEIAEVLIAISAAGKPFIRSIVESCAGRNVNFRIMPAIRDFMTGDFTVDKIRKVKVEDLLGRDPVQLDRSVVADQLRDKCVLVTGAGGSIGSEIARQVAGYAPRALVLLDFAESALFEVDRTIREQYPAVEIIPCLVDIRHAGDVDHVFEKHRPDKVFHAAAYKHVPLMEQHPCDAICTNVRGTRHLVEAAVKYEARKFVMISSDKAVRPGNVMGASKRICELIVGRQHSGATRFASVRFGNVLGSNGSVIPIFEKQIERGGPVRVTDAGMTRFFMTIPEAVELVLQASTLAEANDVFVLDMGEPVRIMDLARNMIDLSGLVPDVDIKIEVTGTRPGEKLHEELVAYGEGLDRTRIDHVRVLRKNHHAPGGEHFEKNLARLEELAMERDAEATVGFLWEMLRADADSAERNADVGAPAR